MHPKNSFDPQHRLKVRHRSNALYLNHNTLQNCIEIFSSSVTPSNALSPTNNATPFNRSARSHYKKDLDGPRPIARHCSKIFQIPQVNKTHSHHKFLTSPTRS